MKIPVKHLTTLSERLIEFFSKDSNFQGPAAQLDALAFERELRRPQNLVVFKVIYLPMTAVLPARLRIYTERFKQYITLSVNADKFDKCDGRIQDMAIVELKERGFNIVAIGEGAGCMYVMSDTFKPFKEK